VTVVRGEDLVESVAGALQYVACYHPPDFLAALARAWRREESPAARDALAQVLVSSRMSAEARRPVCQDTGVVVALVDLGTGVRLESGEDLQALVDAGVRRAWTDPENPLRASMVDSPIGERRNTGDNTPAVVHVRLVAGDRLRVRIAAKGGGSENKSRFVILEPGDSVADWVVGQVAGLGAGWCPPGVLGIGLGGSAEKAMLLAKEALFEPIDIADLRARGARTAVEALRLEIHERVNRLGIGAQGLGGVTTALDVKIRTYPCHAAALPVALIPNCAANRHVEFELDGDGPARFSPPRAGDWPEVTRAAVGDARRVDVDALARDDVRDWRSGERLLLSGRLLTARDAAHRRIAGMLERGERLPDGLDFAGRLVYYVGPVDPVGDEVVGPAGPTSAFRMDRYTEVLLARTGLLGMIGKAERGPAAVGAIRRHGAVYLIAVGGAAYLVSRAIRSARLVAFPELGMEAVRELEVEDMPVTVAVDARGESLHRTGPAAWRERLSGIPVAFG